MTMTAFSLDKVIDRFWKRVDRTDHHGCWPWTASTNEHGYGQFSSVALSNRPIKAHRFAYELAQGTPVPEGLSVLHRCDNPPCCNPAHLYAGTQDDNMRDMRERGRAYTPPLIVDPKDVVRLRAAGLTHARIGEVLGCSQPTVTRILHEVVDS